MRWYGSGRGQCGRRCSVRDDLSLFLLVATSTKGARLTDVRILDDGSLVSITSPMVVTAASGTFCDGSYYIEESDRSAGLKAIGGSVGLGDEVTLTGTLATDANDEKFLQVSSIDSRPSAEPMPPLGLSNKTLSASGTLVRLWGRVKSKIAGSFVMDDGGGRPITVDISGLANPIADLPDVDAYVGVTGLAGYAQPSLLAIKPRSGSDIQTY